MVVLLGIFAASGGFGGKVAFEKGLGVVGGCGFFLGGGGWCGGRELRVLRERETAKGEEG